MSGTGHLHPTHQPDPDAAALRAYEDACLLTIFSSNLITEAGLRPFQDEKWGHYILPGLWMFLARLGEGIPALDPETGGRLWTAVAEIRETPDARAVATPQPPSARVYDRESDALEAISAFDRAGLAVCIDRNMARNDGLLGSLTALLEPRHPDDTGPMVWYGNPPRPLAAPSEGADS